MKVYSKVDRQLIFMGFFFFFFLSFHLRLEIRLFVGFEDLPMHSRNVAGLANQELYAVSVSSEM